MKSLALFGLAAMAVASPAQAPRLGTNPPKLVVVISIDQYRADYLERFADHYLPARSGRKIGGFRFLSETGADYRDAHHNHMPTATGPGHATLLTGSEPALNGIAGNSWFDRAKNRERYVVEDDAVESVGGNGGKMSPRPLRVTTVGDELKMATNGQSKVVGIAIKDRASILMAGHSADTVIWFDGSTGNWVTSSWYAPSGKLPTWVQAWNDSRAVDKAFGTRWEPLLPERAYSFARRAPAEKASDNGKLFSWPLGTGQGKPDRSYYGAMTSSYFGNEFVFETSKRAVEAERLGSRGVPDLLCVNLSTNDYVGHRFGPNSPEVMDISIRTDRLLSDFFTFLDGKLGIDNVTIVVTADHGVVPIPAEAAQIYRLPAKAGLNDLKAPVTKALNAAFGEGDWVLGDGLVEQNFYLNRETARAKKVSMAEVERVAAEAIAEDPDVYAAFTRTQIMNGNLPKWSWISRVTNGFNPRESGDVVVITRPGMYPSSGTGTGHGSAWDYDSHVPILLRGRGVHAGTYTRRVQTADIASSLSILLGIEYPSGNMGVPLHEALDRKR